MNKSFVRISKKSFLGKMYQYKISGYKLVDIIASKDNDKTKLKYILLYENKYYFYEVEYEKDKMIDSICDIFPEGLFIENKIKRKMGISFNHKKEINKEFVSDVSRIPFGPQHAMLLEPIKLWLYMKDEIILKTLFEGGYVDKSIEEIVLNKNVINVGDIFSRISGQASFTYSLAYYMAVEDCLEIEVPIRAKQLRTIFAEIDRIQQCLFTLSNVANALSAESLRYTLLELRQRLLDAVKKYSDHRTIIEINRVGGISKDLTKEQVYELGIIVTEIAEDITKAYKVFNRKDIKTRLLTGKLAINDFDLVSGIPAKAFGILKDERQNSYLAYTNYDNQFTSTNSDCNARVSVMIDEIKKSSQLIDKILEEIQQGEICTNEYEFKTGFGLASIEEFSGTLFSYVEIEDNGILKNFSIRNATTFNVYHMLKSLEGNEFANLPLIISTFGLNISGMEL